MKSWLLLLFMSVLFGCNSKEAQLTSIQGLRDPNDPFPFITNIVAQGPGRYLTASTLNFTVTFSEPVLVTGTPGIKITADSGIIPAFYQSGSGTDTLIFSLTVAAGNYDVDGIVLANSITLNGGSIYDPDDDDDALLSFTAPSTVGVQLDGINGAITAVVPPADRTYKTNEHLDFIVRFNVPVDAVGIPVLPISLGGATRNAGYYSGTGTTDLVFRYTVPAGINDNNGTDIVASDLDLASGSITDPFGDSVVVALPTVFNPGVRVDSVAPTISSVAVPANGEYFPTQGLDFTLTFSEPVNVAGTPYININLDSGTVQAVYHSGTGTTNLLFRYVVAVNHLDLSGISVNTLLVLNGGRIEDVAGNNISALTMSVPATNLIKVDGVAPAITGKTISLYGPSPYTFSTGQVLNLNINFNDTMYVTGSPYVPIRINGSIHQATCITAIGSTLVFRLTVPSGLLDTDGIEMLPIELNGGDIREGPIPQALPLVNYSEYIDTTARVDSILPTVTSVTLSSGQGSYKFGLNSNVTFTVNFSKNVTVIGTPFIPAEINGTGPVAILKSSASGSSVTFQYAIDSMDMDLDGVTFPTLAIDLNGGSIKDSLGNDAVLTLQSTIRNNKIYIIPPELEYWFDVSDSLSAIKTAGGLLTGLNSKADSLTSTFSGTFPTVVDDGVSVYAHFSNDSAFTYGPINANYVIMVIKTPMVRAPNIYSRKPFSLGDGYFHLMNNGDVSLGSCVGCEYYRAGWNGTFLSLGVQILSGYTWYENQETIVSLKMNKFGANFKIGDAYEDGYIAEIITLNSATPPAYVFNEIYNYYQIKYPNAFW